MVSLDEVSIGLVFSIISMLFVLSMIFYYIYYEKIKEYCILLSKKINKIVENKILRINEYLSLKSRLDILFNKLISDDISKEELQKDIEYIKDKMDKIYQLIQ